jgi:hypothetical protein
MKFSTRVDKLFVLLLLFGACTRTPPTSNSVNQTGNLIQLAQSATPAIARAGTAFTPTPFISAKSATAQQPMQTAFGVQIDGCDAPVWIV